MKKILSLLLVVLLTAALVLPVMATPEGPVITMQPQSPNYPNYSVAIYTVKVEGKNLSATWYMEWQGKTYNISNIGGSMQPWEAYAGESYGARKLDDNTFMFLFEGIESDLDGAYIWCVIEDGHYDVTSQKARVSVGNPSTPPEIVSIPAGLTVQQGDMAELRCVARSNDESQLTFLWFETDTGRLEDMRAVNRGEETSDYMFCDTSQLGTRNYLCMVQTSNGGITYSSIVPVTVVEKTEITPAPEILTESLPEAEVGTLYTAQLLCSDPAATFAVYYNPGGDNDFDKTGLNLSEDGTISGIPAAAGSYSFCVCAAGAGGEDYRVYTLKVSDPAAPETTVPAETTLPPETTEPVASTQPQKPPASDPTTPPASDSTDPTASPTTGTVNPPQQDENVPWWVLVIIGVAAAGVGVGVAVMLTRKKS